MPEWAELFDNYGIKTVSATDKQKFAYVPTATQRFAMVSAGLEPSSSEDKAVLTINVLFDPKLKSIQISYYNSKRAGSGRLPEPRIGQGLPKWIAKGDSLIIGNVGKRVFVAKDPIPPVGQAFLTTENGAFLTTDDGSRITVPVEPDLDRLAYDLEAGRPVLIGNPADLRRRSLLRDRVRELEEELDRLRPNHGGIGHNNPPADSQAEAPSPKILDLVAASVETIRTEVEKGQPDAVNVARSGSFLRNMADWLAGKGNVFADEFAKAFGKSLGDAAGKAVAAAGLIMLLGSLVASLTGWLQAITWPF